MRNATFKRVNGEFHARPFQGWEYRITGQHPDYTLTFNGSVIGMSDRRDLLIDAANLHLHDNISRKESP
jgi:lipocalin